MNLPPIDLEKPTSVEVLKKLMQSSDPRADAQKEYIIGAGDVLKIYMVGREDIIDETANKEGFKITENPNLFLPYVGSIRVHGKSAKELEADLKAAYTKFIVDPHPTVIIEKYEYHQVALIGAVNKPGKMGLQGGDTLLDAIFKAGGLRQGFNEGGAPGRYLKVYREALDREEKVKLSLDELIQRISKGDQVSSREEFRVPIEDYLLNGQLTYNIPLQPNDVIFVPSSGTVSVQGRVNSPGVASLGPSLRTVTQIITARGGMRFGGKSNIEVVRSPRNDGEQPQVFRMDVRRMLDRTAPDFILQDGDQIFVDGSWLRSTLEFMGSILKSGSSTGVQAVYRAPVTGGI